MLVRQSSSVYPVQILGVSWSSPLHSIRRNLRNDLVRQASGIRHEME